MLETINYKGKYIEVDHHYDAENPFEMWDACVPLISKSNYGFRDYSKGQIINYLKGFLTDNQIIHHQKKLLDILAYDWSSYDLDPEEKIDEIRDHFDELNFSQLSKFCNMFKIPCYSGISKGYSQGDWSDIFICETPEYLEISGCQTLTEESMKSGFDLWGYWAWGDVYSYLIDDGDIGSCCGFYGTNHEESGLLEHAKEDIDAYYQNNKNQRFKKLKSLIKNNVPYQYRFDIINQFEIA